MILKHLIHLFSVSISLEVNCPKLHSQLSLVIVRVNFLSDLVEFILLDLNVVLGMNWLGRFKAQIDYEAKKVSLVDPKK